MADYMNMTNDSVVHVIDRFSAVILVVAEISKIIWMYSFMKSAVFGTYSLALLLAIGSFIKSQECQSRLDTQGFIFWHCCWHLYPIAVAIIVFVDTHISDPYGVSPQLIYSILAVISVSCWFGYKQIKY